MNPYKIIKNTALAIPIVVLSAGLYFAPTAGFANLPTDSPLQRQVLPLPALPSDEQTLSSTVEISTPQWQEHKVKIRKNESLSTALDSLDISAATTYEIGRLKNSNLLTNLRTGDELKIWVDKDHHLQKILYLLQIQNLHHQGSHCE